MYCTRMLLLPLLATLTCGVSVPEVRKYPGELKVWVETSHFSDHYTFRDDNPQLSSIGFDNTIESYKVTGVWLLYDGYNYNSELADPSRMYPIHGIDTSEDLPTQYRNMATSLRYCGSTNKLNDQHFCLYSKVFFSDDSFSSSVELDDLSFITFDVASVIVVGDSDWTFCESENYLGKCVCFKPDTHHDDTLFRELDVGLYDKLDMCELGTMTVRSARRGCYGSIYPAC